ncbi:MAG: hypothetical protein ACK4Q5_14180, partial [Saprospiraceae bacterium]
MANAHFRQLDSLLKIKSFGTAYARLQRLERTLPANDTLLLMQGFCLLEMGEGSEAAGRFGQLADKPTPWQPSARWHQALGLLSAGRDVEALGVFKTIAGTACSAVVGLKRLYAKLRETLRLLSGTLRDGLLRRVAQR